MFNWTLDREDMKLFFLVTLFSTNYNALMIYYYNLSYNESRDINTKLAL